MESVSILLRILVVAKEVDPPVEVDLALVPLVVQDLILAHLVEAEDIRLVALLLAVLVALLPLVGHLVVCPPVAVLLDNLLGPAAQLLAVAPLKTPSLVAPPVAGTARRPMTPP